MWKWTGTWRSTFPLLLLVRAISRYPFHFKSSLWYTPSPPPPPPPIAKLKTHLLLWRFFSFERSSYILHNFFAHRFVWSVKVNFLGIIIHWLFLGGGGGFQICTFLSVINISTEACIIKWALSLLCIDDAAFSLSSWFLSLLILSWMSPTIQSEKNTEKFIYHSYFDINC